MSACATCGEFINEGVCKCPRGLESMAGSIKIGWWIDRDPGATFDASELVTKLPVVLDRLEDALTSALSQCVDVYIDGEDNPPVRVMFDLGGKEIEIDDGPINGTLDDIRGGGEWSSSLGWVPHGSMDGVTSQGFAKND